MAALGIAGCLSAACTQCRTCSEALQRLASAEGRLHGTPTAHARSSAPSCCVCNKSQRSRLFGRAGAARTPTPCGSRTACSPLPLQRAQTSRSIRVSTLFSPALPRALKLARRSLQRRVYPLPLLGKGCRPRWQPRAARQRPSLPPPPPPLDLPPPPLCRSLLISRC